MSKRWPIGVLLLLAMTGCTYTQFQDSTDRYMPPPDDVLQFAPETIVGAPYDETWSRLIDMLPRSFFSIEVLDKESGFIRLGFTETDPDQVINCGKVLLRGRVQSYALYLARENDLHVNGQVNITVKALDPTQTVVRVHVRYIFGPYDFVTGKQHTQRWVAIRLVGRSDVTCRPTYRVEEIILAAAMGEEGH